MDRNICEKSAYQLAYERWFSRYEEERRRQRRRKGTQLIGFPEPPASPAAIAELVDLIGPRSVITILEIHRSTLAR